MIVVLSGECICRRGAITVKTRAFIVLVSARALLSSLQYQAPPRAGGAGGYQARRL